MNHGSGGNASVYDESLDDPQGPDPHFYAFGRLRQGARFGLQRRLGGSPIRVLFGAGLETTGIEPVPEGRGNTLYAISEGSAEGTYWTNFVRAAAGRPSSSLEGRPRAEAQVPSKPSVTVGVFKAGGAP